MVQDHHSKGYLPPFQDFVEPYCKSCDWKAHDKARKDGKCNLTHTEAQKFSIASSDKRNRVKKSLFSKTVTRNIRLKINLEYRKGTDDIKIYSGFVCTVGLKLKYIDIL